jgi:chromosome segregation ATPase
MLSARAKGVQSALLRLKQEAEARRGALLREVEQLQVLIQQLSALVKELSADVEEAERLVPELQRLAEETSALRERVGRLRAARSSIQRRLEELRRARLDLEEMRKRLVQIIEEIDALLAEEEGRRRASGTSEPGEARAGGRGASPALPA